jgi:hypothetical protein
MGVEVPPETSVLINEITEHDIAKTAKLIEKNRYKIKNICIVYTSFEDRKGHDNI